jgi:hypothetical protein
MVGCLREKRKPLTKEGIISVARQAHTRMTTYPTGYLVTGVNAEFQGTNWTVSVGLYLPPSRPNLGNWDGGFEVFRISADGKVLSYEVPQLFP